MGRKTAFTNRSKTKWTQRMIDTIYRDWDETNNPELARRIGVGIHVLRDKLRELGLKRMELEYWPKDAVDFLKENYKTIGDTELTEIFNVRWPKNKGWTKKHIEKKRKQLQLRRTRREIKCIHQRNVDAGRFLLCPVKRWLVQGVAKEGEIRMWRSQSGRFVPRIKIAGRFIHWNRWAWEQHYGTIPKGMSIVFKDNNPKNMSINNLEMVNRVELARRNCVIASQGLSDNYVVGMLSHGNPDIRKHLKNNEELIEIKRASLLLNRTINNQL